MAVPDALFQQLLELDERTRIELAHRLLDSTERDDAMSEAERTKLNEAIELGLAEADAGKGIPFDEAMASLRARRDPRLAR